jgi:hypothetical protein
MATAKNPVRKTKSKDKQAEKFIIAASEGTPKADADERFTDTDPVCQRIVGTDRLGGKEERPESQQLAEICSHKGIRYRGAIDA